MDGEIYMSIEHAYQAAKTLDRTERRVIRMAITPGEAKGLGGPKGIIRHMCRDWEDIKADVMYGLLVKKFRAYPFNEMLLDTGDSHLEEGNHHGDTVWGTVDGKGQNLLGRLLMIVREELRCA